MTRKHGPKPVVDGADESPEVRALLAAGGTDEIDYDFDRGLAAHLGAIGVVPGPSGPGPSASASASAKASVSGLSSKALLLLIGAPIAAVSAGVALSFGALGGLGGPAGSVASVASVAVVAAVASGAASGPAVPESTIAERERSETSTARTAASTDGERPTSSRGLGGARPHAVPRSAALGSEGTANLEKALLPISPEALPERTGAGLGLAGERSAERLSNPGSSTPAATEPSVAVPTAASAAAERAEEAALETAAQRRKASAEEAARVADQRLEREMTALAEAKHALSSDPARALSLAREGERDFPHGVFGEERRHILILALIRLGRLDEARRLAAPYLEQHPDSPFARRVRTALDAAGSKR